MDCLVAMPSSNTDCQNGYEFFAAKEITEATKCQSRCQAYILPTLITCLCDHGGRCPGSYGGIGW